MHIIDEINLFDADFFICTCCKNKTDFASCMNVDHQNVCDECFDEGYSHLVKCSISGCKEHDEPSNLINGMCEPCYEVNTPLSREDQEGWEHNIFKQIETG